LPAQGMVTMNFQNVIQKLEQEKARLESAINALRKLSNGANGTSRSSIPNRNSVPQERRGSRLSAAGRRRIAQAQRARWAKHRQKKS
jgi:hypothetical protein